MLHSVAPPSANVPAEQVPETAVSPIEAHALPGVHGKHIVEPLTGEKLPGAHDGQLAAALLGPCVPATQLKQLDAPELL